MGRPKCGKLVWLALALMLAPPHLLHAQPKLPSSEEFGNAVYACALDSNINLSASALGSIKTFYEGQKTEGKASLTQSSKFLSMFPEGDRKDMYKVYVDCI